jgi:hypothetical protein
VSVPVAVFLVVGLVTVGLLLALLVALIRHLKTLSRTVTTFRKATEPTIREIREGSLRAQALSAAIESRRTASAESLARARTARRLRRRRVEGRSGH